MRTTYNGGCNEGKNTAYAREVRKILEEKAKEECRSFSAEVIKRVMDSLKREGITV